MSNSVAKWQEIMEDMYGNIDDCSYTYLESDVNNIEVNEPEEVEISNKAQLRKNTPVFSGCVAYFPLALKEIAKASVQGQAQHNPDKPLAWDRSKSGDELDAMMRHLIDHASGEIFDDCGTRHIVKCGWRILAFIQKTMENEGQH